MLWVTVFDPLFPLVALDIETDTSGGGGLDPVRAGIVALALAFSDASSQVFADTDEAVLLTRASHVLRRRAGLLVTWNGGGFDLPFIVARARILGLDLGLATVFDPDIVVKYPPSPGLGGPVRGRWASMSHVDIAPLYRNIATDLSVSWNLKAVARAFGLTPVEVDRTHVHELTAAELDAYVMSDALVTLDLAARLPQEMLLAAILPVPHL